MGKTQSIDYQLFLPSNMAQAGKKQEPEMKPIGSFI